jgi:hypothetical protein
VLLRVFELSAGLRARCEAAERDAASARAGAASAAERRAEAEAQLARLQQRGSAAAAALEQELAQAEGEARESKQKLLDSLRLSDGLHEQAALGARLKARVEEGAGARGGRRAAARRGGCCCYLSCCAFWCCCSYLRLRHCWGKKAAAPALVGAAASGAGSKSERDCRVVK